MVEKDSLDLLQNPFIKIENREWVLNVPATLSKDVTPPPPSRKRRRIRSPDDGQDEVLPSTADVEAGNVEIKDHFDYFSKKLLAATRPLSTSPRLRHEDWLKLYQRNQHAGGRHFVIHQHDHPVAGTHYDLRLQCNETSSISFAIMYGLPGDPNSRRLNRNAMETRVHNLWVRYRCR